MSGRRQTTAAAGRSRVSTSTPSRQMGAGAPPPCRAAPAPGPATTPGAGPGVTPPKTPRPDALIADYGRPGGRANQPAPPHTGGHST